MAMAEWMISRGAKNLILLGASSDSVMAARKHFKEMPGVQAEAVDVSNLDALSALFDELAKRGLPLRGVIHAAMKMDDGLCQDLTPDRLATVLGPKAGGAWNLHLLTRDLNLDFFVMVSSISSLVGNPGQGNYAAANAFLDALTHLRHSQNLPALTINWGHLGEVGYAARHSQVSSHLERYGFPAMGLQEAMGLLEKMMLSKNPRVAAMRVDWNLWAQANPRAKKSPLYTELICQDSENDLPGSGGLAEAILNASEAERKKLLEAFIRETAARVLGMPASKIDPSRPLNEIGLDSLMSIELVNRIEEGLGMKFPIEKLVGGPNIITLAKILSAAMPSSTGNASR
jgi:acyl carrier protein